MPYICQKVRCGGCAQVAFENAPAPGFYDTSGEKDTTKELARQFRPTTLEELEGGKRRKARPVALHVVWDPGLGALVSASDQAICTCLTWLLLQPSALLSTVHVT